MVSHYVIMEYCVLHPRSDSRNWPRSSKCSPLWPLYKPRVHLSPSRENLSLKVCDQVSLEPTCSATETSWSLVIMDFACICIIRSRERTTKKLIRLRKCTSWSASLLFAYGILQVFSRRSSLMTRRKGFFLFIANCFTLVISQLISYSFFLCYNIISAVSRVKILFSNSILNTGNNLVVCEGLHYKIMHYYNNYVHIYLKHHTMTLQNQFVVSWQICNLLSDRVDNKIIESFGAIAWTFRKYIGFYDLLLS